MSEHTPEHATDWSPDQLAELIGGPTLVARLAYVRKAIVNVAGLLASLLTLGLMPSPWDKYVATVLAVLTAVLHYWVSNGDAPGVKDNTAWVAAEQPPPAQRVAGEPLDHVED